LLLESFETTGQNIQVYGGIPCERRIWRAYRTIQNLIDGGRSEVINEMFHLCHPLDASDAFEVANFYLQISQDVTSNVMTGITEIAEMCQEIGNATITNDLIAFASWFNAEQRASGCYGRSGQEVIDFQSETDWDSLTAIAGDRQIFYLRCTEHGWFATTDSDAQPFGNQIGIEFYVEWCRRVFGDWMTEETISEGIAKSNVVFGGSEPVLTNAYFVNSGLGSRHLINVNSIVPERDVEVRILQSYPQSYDMYSITESDSVLLRYVKNRATDHITRWVQAA